MIMLQVHKSCKFGENGKFGRLRFSLKRDYFTRCNPRTFLSKFLIPLKSIIPGIQVFIDQIVCHPYLSVTLRS